jgi:hypothetical protein
MSIIEAHKPAGYTDASNTTRRGTTDDARKPDVRTQWLENCEWQICSSRDGGATAIMHARGCCVGVKGL